jgi:hypothetical protein
MADFGLTRRRKPVAGSQMAHADDGAFAATGRALTAAGGAVSQVAGVLDELAVRKQTVLNRKSIADARRKFSEEGVGLKLEMSQEGDRTKLGKIQQRRSAQLRKDLITEDVAPEVREQIESDWADFESKTKIAVKTEEVRRLGIEAQVSVMGEYDRHLEDGNLLMANASVKAAVADGVFDAAEGDKLIKAAEVEIQRKDVYKHIIADPVNAQALLSEKTEGGNFKNFKKLSDVDRRVFMSSARTEQNRIESEFYGEVISAVQISGAQEHQRKILWDRVQEMQSTGRMSDTRAVALHNTLFPKGNLPTKWKDTLYSIFNDIEAIDVNAERGDMSNDAVDLRQRIATANIPPGERGRLMGKLDDKFAGKTPGGVDNLVVNEAMKRARKMVDDRVSITSVGLDATESADAGQRRYEVQSALRAWFEKNPDADVLAADEFIKSYLSADSIGQLNAIQETARYAAEAGQLQEALEPTTAKKRELFTEEEADAASRGFRNNAP